MTGKVLGPPRGADATRAATLASRFHNDASEASTAPSPADPAAAAPTRRPSAGRRSRGEPDGMTRRTLYLPIEVADDLSAAADEIAAACPLAPRHQVLTALLRHGLDHVDDARADVRQQLVDSLTPK